MSESFSKLVSAYLFGTATEQEIAELQSLIRSDERYRKRFVRDAYLHRVIRDVLHGSNAAQRFSAMGTDAVLKLPRPHPSQGGKFWWMAGPGSIAAAILIVVSLWWGANHSSRSVTDLGADILAGAVVLENGVAKVREGYGVIRHESGAVFALAGGAEAVISGNDVELRKGRISAVYNDAASRRISVKTKAAVIEDLGTEFSAEVLAGGSTRVDVIRGKVRIMPAKSTPLELIGGESLLVHLSGTVEKGSLGQDVLSVAAAAMTMRADGGWADYAKRLMDDPSLLLWVDGHSLAGEGRLANLVVRSNTGLVTSESAMGVVEGRFKSDGAVRIDHVDQAIAVDMPTHLESITLVTWLRLDEEDTGQLRHRGLLLSEEANRSGQLHWQLKGADFRISLRSQDGSNLSFAAMTDALAGKRWMMLATVIDGPERSIRHYVDGQMVYERVEKQDLPELTLGRCWVGGWRGAQDTTGQFRALHGDLDELMIWSRPLSAVEVAELARKASPQVAAK